MIIDGFEYPDNYESGDRTLFDDLCDACFVSFLFVALCVVLLL